ncbi:MBL fold metallo-hydrolase [Microbacterium sp. cf332]|uniref:MBL fold metallo-hydrolase n=1 Tax=Microbacterium sp. cf332 TaxID=1761804 RepID=UPI00088A093B|nr:MBL fold metallo-hydrolase [Microbacterium sp. cf332]SDQ89663.1 Glyoxylase, beta-lactamase superfamily II [Microbacterium sp. cf332]
MTDHRPRVSEVADGVFQLARAGVNAYLVAADNGLVLIDAGLPRTWPLLERTLASLGARASDIDALLLTHGHFDHVGMCERLVEEHRLVPRVHPGDAELVRHPYRYAHENARLPYPFRYPGAVPILGRVVVAGALGVTGVRADPTIFDGDMIPLAGGIVAIATPGHTGGHCAFLLEARGILLTGDALVTLDPYTGRTGPRVVARAATARSDDALRSLSLLAETEASLVLPGHGEAWDRGGIASAVAIARSRGVD